VGPPATSSPLPAFRDLASARQIEQPGGASLWLAKFDALKPERDALAEELRELYPDAVAKIVYSFVRIPPVIARSPPGTPR
jgi:hypothetical protein